MIISATTLSGNSATGTTLTGVTNQMSSPVLDSESASSPIVDNSIDTTNSSNQNLLVARSFMTQQVQIALQLSSVHSPYQTSQSDASQTQASTSQYLTQQALHKIGQQHHDARHSKEHSAPIIRNVLMSIEQGFSTTSAVLAQAGLLQGQVADEVTQTRDEVMQTVQRQASVLDNSANTDNIHTMSLDSISAQRTLTTSFELTTREGDIVTVNLSRSQSMTADRLNSNSNELLNLNSTREMQFEITIQGELNDKESRSIHKAIQQVSEIARKMFSGKIGAALEKLDEFHINTRQLAGMALSMTSSQSVMATSAYTQISNSASEGATTQQAQQDSALTSPINNSVDSQAQASSDNTVNVQSASAITDSGPNKTASELTAPGEESVAVVISTIARESASSVTEIVNNSNLQNPFQQIRQMFSAISTLMYADMGSHHHHSIMQLFDGITDHVERRHHHAQKSNRYDD